MKMNNITFKPTVFWAWNSDMTDEELKSSLEWFYEQGIGGVFVHARAGLNIEYLGKRWFEAYKFVIEECKKKNIEVWIYDEQGWPSGFAGGLVSEYGEDYIIKHLCITSNFEEVDQSRIIASYKKVGENYQLAQLKEAELFIYYKVEPPYVDLLNPKVTDKFIEVTHEVYKKHFQHEFGRTIKGVFTDEPQIHVSSLAWSTEIESMFKKINGYDYLEKLPLLFMEENNENAKKYRYDYYKTVRYLFTQNYTRRISEWCSNNNLIFTGHFAGEEGLVIQAASNTGVMPHYEYMTLPGIDSLGNRLNAPLLMKQVQSVAAQWERKRILSETFACTGNGVNFQELKKIWGYHLSFGINYPCMSISMTSLGGIRKRDYPVFISNQQPWEKYFHYFSKWVENSGKLTMLGEYKADVLVISSINSTLYEKIFSLEQRIVSSNYRKVIEMLLNLQIQYDIGDELLIEKYGEIKNGLFKVNKGSYSIVLLPEQTGINIKTLELLKEFHSQGGIIIQFERFPEYLEGVKSDIPKKELTKIVSAVLQERERILEKYWLANQIERHVHIVDKYGKTIPNLIVKVNYDKGNLIFSVFNKSNNTIDGFIKINVSGSIFEIDIISNNKTSKTLYLNEKDTIGTLSIKSGELKFYKFSKDMQVMLTTFTERKEEIVMNFIDYTDDNILVIDCAKVEYEDKKIDLLPTVQILKQLFDEANYTNKKITAKVIYQFNTEILTKLQVAFEYKGMFEFRVNNKVLWRTGEPLFGNRFKDRSLVLVDISDNVKLGNNFIEISYNIDPLNMEFDINDVHDSVRNKFSYSSHIEQIYICGKFDVYNSGKTFEDEKAITVEGPFTLTKQKNKTIGDITLQDSYFYTGNLLYEGKFDYLSGLIELSLSFDGSGAIVFINGVEVGAFDSDIYIEVTSYVKKGENSLVVKLLGNLRNMMGPFHHISKEPEYTGVHTFTGEYGNGAVEDLSSNGITENIWTDMYHVKRFGLNKVVVRNKVKKEIKK